METDQCQKHQSHDTDSNSATPKNLQSTCPNEDLDIPPWETWTTAGHVASETPCNSTERCCEPWWLHGIISCHPHRVHSRRIEDLSYEKKIPWLLNPLLYGMRTLLSLQHLDIFQHEAWTLGSYFPSQPGQPLWWRWILLFAYLLSCWISLCCYGSYRAPLLFAILSSVVVEICVRDAGGGSKLKRAVQTAERQMAELSNQSTRE